MRALLSFAAIIAIFFIVCVSSAEKTLREYRRERKRFDDMPVVAHFYRFKEAPNNWMTITPLGIQSLYLSKVYIIFPHEPACFEPIVWKNVLAVGLKKEGTQFADIILVDRFAKTGTSVVDMVFDTMPSRLRGKNVHCIGVGFGAHLCALIGKRYVDTYGDGIGRLTALDPMGESERELVGDNGDLRTPLHYDYVDVAGFVDVIHTSYLGTTNLIGDVDVFVNSGIVQPQCLPLNLATEIINVCHERHLKCPPMDLLHGCAFNDTCPARALALELDETIRSVPLYAEEFNVRSYSNDLYQMFRPSQERAVLLFAASLQPYINCPACKPSLDINMCQCNEEILSQNYANCPAKCEKPELFGLKLNPNTTGTFHISTSGWWPYFTCVAKNDEPTS